MSTPPSHRGNTRRNQATQQLIVFRLRQERFALPIQFAYKVIPMGQTYGVCQNEGVSLTRYQDRDVLIIDIQRRIFTNAVKQHLLSGLSSSTADSQFDIHLSHLLLMQTSQGELIGIPLDKPPSLQRVANSAFTPVPPAYLQQGGIRCISALVVPAKDESPIFLLNPNQLIQVSSTQSLSTQSPSALLSSIDEL
jgi:chemotaxis signal transduction protein